jgi:signal transduction histidine kinase
MTETAQPASILIIDDEEIVHKSCRRIFRREGYRIESAFSGEEGLEKVRNGAFDIVITDLMMPGMGGMEVLRTLVRERPELPVIVFTGYATVDSVREALKLGAFDYVPKPFTPDEVSSVVKNALQARAEKGERSMLDLMAIVSHDLRSPIAVVHTQAETLYKGYFGELAPAQRQALEAIIRNCVYLEDIIRSYLDLSNVDLGGLQSFKSRVDLAEQVVRPVVEAPEHQNNFRSMKIELQLEGKPQVEADPNLLKIVVSNLLGNAVKYGRDGGTIRVKVGEESRMAVLSVWNEGVGIAAEDIEKRLFQKHVRLKQPGTEGVKGNGLGLYICRSIVEKHQGDISCRSEPGRWAEFTVRLPRSA